MQISLNWLKQYIDFEIDKDEISRLLTGCGLEVEAIEPFESVKGGLRGLIVGHVLETAQHPNADRLTVCKVDLGNGTISQIVCGAPNVSAGQKVIVAIPGTVIYPAKGEPFEIKKSKIRGEASEGMICAEDEIGLGNDHSGILILENSAVTGEPAVNYFHVEEDYSIAIGLTPNRPDAASHIGVARDLCAVVNTASLGGTSLKSHRVVMPDVSTFKTHSGSSSIHVTADDSDVIRYSGIHLANIKVAPSPDWLKNRLKAVGINPINNVVDITNYVMMETGQPLHAFDASKIAGRTVIVKKLPAGTLFTTLDGVERKLSGTELMICDENGGMCMAGIFGGLHSGVSDATVEVFLESACFSPVSVRKASKLHGLKTDSSFRFERGTDPEMVIPALKRAALLMAEICGGETASSLVDIYPWPVEWKKIEFRMNRFHQLTGITLDLEAVKQMLEWLDFRIISADGSNLQLEVPPYRVDVTREADVSEEILRIYGYDRIPMPEVMRISMPSGNLAPLEKRRNGIAQHLVANGFNEIMSNSLFRSSAYDESMAPMLARIKNPLSQELDVMRPDLLLPMLDAAVYNQNRQRSDLRIFEFGKMYAAAGQGYEEKNGAGILFNGLRRPASWDGKKQDYNFYHIRSVIEQVLIAAGFSLERMQFVAGADHPQLEETMEVRFNSEIALVFGRVRKKLMKQWGLQGPSWYALLNLDLLEHHAAAAPLRASEPPRFPEVHRDLSMILDRGTRYADLEQLAFQTDKGLLRAVSLFDVYEDEKLGENKKSYALSFVLRDDEKTLTDKDIDKAMQRIMDAFEQKLGAVIRKA